MDAEAFIADYFKGLSEKGIDNARHDLGALLSQSVEEVRRGVLQGAWGLRLA